MKTSILIITLFSLVFMADARSKKDDCKLFEEAFRDKSVNTFFDLQKQQGQPIILYVRSKSPYVCQSFQIGIKNYILVDYNTKSQQLGRWLILDMKDNSEIIELQIDDEPHEKAVRLQIQNRKGKYKIIKKTFVPNES